MDLDKTNSILRQVFTDLHAYFNPKEKALAAPVTFPLPIRQYFYLLMLTDKDLKNLASNSNNYVRYRSIRKSAILELERSLTSDFNDLSHECLKTLKSIIENLYALLSINETKFDDEVNEIAKAAETFVKNQVSYFDISDSFIKQSINLLKKIMENQDPKYYSAKNAYNIYQLQQEGSLPEGITIDISPEKQSLFSSIVENEEKKVSIVYQIYDDLLKLQYALSSYVNDEILFLLAFIDNELLSFTTKLHALFKKRSSLYTRILLSIPTNCQIPFLEFNATQIHYDKEQRDYMQTNNPLLYYRLRTIIKNYIVNDSLINTKKIDYSYGPIPLTETLKNHLRFIFYISKDTYIFDEELPLTYRNKPLMNLDILQATLKFTNQELAEVLGIDPSAISKTKNQENLALRAHLSLFCNYSRIFFLEKTTSPYYEKMTSFQFFLPEDTQNDSIKPDSAKQNLKPVPYTYTHSNARLDGQRILNAFQNYFETDIQTRKRLIKESAEAINDKQKFAPLVKHIKFLQKNIDSITPAQYEAIECLLNHKKH